MGLTETLQTLNPFWAASNESNAYFEEQDHALHHGNQLMWDGAGLVPGLGYATSGAQGIYHTQHAIHDIAKGDYNGGLAQGLEAAWGFAGAVPALHHALMPFHLGEFLWDQKALDSRENGGHMPDAAQGISHGLADGAGWLFEKLTGSDVLQSPEKRDENRFNRRAHQDDPWPFMQ